MCCWEVGLFHFYHKEANTLNTHYLLPRILNLFCNNANNKNNKPKHIFKIRLLQHLCFTSNNAEQGQDEETLTTDPSKPREHTTSLLQDSIEQTADTHLIAHSVAAQHTLQQTNIVHERFLVHGREALKIGLYSLNQ